MPLNPRHHQAGFGLGVVVREEEGAAAAAALEGRHRQSGMVWVVLVYW